MYQVGSATTGTADYFPPPEYSNAFQETDDIATAAKCDSVVASILDEIAPDHSVPTPLPAKVLKSCPLPSAHIPFASKPMTMASTISSVPYLSHLNATDNKKITEFLTKQDISLKKALIYNLLNPQSSMTAIFTQCDMYSQQDQESYKIARKGLLIACHPLTSSFTLSETESHYKKATSIDKRRATKMQFEAFLTYFQPKVQEALKHWRSCEEKPSQQELVDTFQITPFDAMEALNLAQHYFPKPRKTGRPVSLKSLSTSMDASTFQKIEATVGKYLTGLERSQLYAFLNAQKEPIRNALIYALENPHEPQDTICKQGPINAHHYKVARKALFMECYPLLKHFNFSKKESYLKNATSLDKRGSVKSQFDAFLSYFNLKTQKALSIWRRYEKEPPLSKFAQKSKIKREAAREGIELLKFCFPKNKIAKKMEAPWSLDILKHPSAAAEAQSVQKPSSPTTTSSIEPKPLPPSEYETEEEVDPKLRKIGRFDPSAFFSDAPWEDSIEPVEEHPEQMPYSGFKRKREEEDLLK